jgi:hypothetical protein
MKRSKGKLFPMLWVPMSLVPVCYMIACPGTVPLDAIGPGK